MTLADGQQAARGISRRSVLRGGLLAGAGVATAGATSAVLSGTASAASTQNAWAHCTRCAALFWSGNGNFGVCPNPYLPSQSHALLGGTYNYSLDYDVAGTDNTSRPQGNWRWCNQCYALFWGPSANQVCIANRMVDGLGPHTPGTPSTSYAVPWGNTSADTTTNPQGWWSWCGHCAELYWQGPSGLWAGACATGEKHLVGSATIYDVYHYTSYPTS
jgi:hypothetical protein